MRNQSTAPTDVLTRVARGDADAVRDCLERFSPLVWSIVKKLWREPASMEDLVQEIFIEIWRSAARFDPDKASEATFIATIARRRTIDRQRRTGRGPREEDIEERTVSIDDEGLSGVDLGDDARRAHEALAHLKPDQRRVILMSVVDGLTHQEIATATGLALGTVKSHIRRGLDKAAQMLRPSRGEASP